MRQTMKRQSANEHRYDTLITNLTADQTEWRQRYEAHQRTAPTTTWTTAASTPS